MKRFVFISVICVLICFFSLVTAAELVDSGRCGDNMTWSVDSDGILTISGTGDMWNYPIKTIEVIVGMWSDKGSSWDLQYLYYESDFPESAIVEIWIGDETNGRFVLYEQGRPYITQFIGDADNGKWELIYTDRPYNIIYIGEEDNGEWTVVYTDRPYEIVYVGDEADGRWVVVDPDYGYYAEWIGLEESDGYLPKGYFTAIKTVPWHKYDIKKIVLSSDVTDICMGPLVSYYFEVEEGNSSFYADDNGVLYTKDMKTLISCPSTYEGTSFTISDGVVAIEYSAFSYCEALTHLKIPETTKNICTQAFNGCVNLEDIEFPAGLESVGSEAFENTAWIDNQPSGIVYAGSAAYTYKFPEDYMPDEENAGISLAIKNGTTCIADWAFEDVAELMAAVELPESLISIGEGAFCCSGIETVEIPRGVKEIGDYAFSDSAVSTIYGYEGSAAQIYAVENNIEFLSVSVPYTVTKYENNKCDISLFNITESNVVVVCGYKNEKMEVSGIRIVSEGKVEPVDFGETDADMIKVFLFESLGSLKPIAAYELVNI